VSLAGIILTEFSDEPSMRSWTIGQRVAKSILAEASSIKAGNVHPHASFPDMQFRDFQIASVAIGQAFDRVIPKGRLGDLVLEATRAMVQSVSVNTSLGTILLLAPLALGTSSPVGLPGEHSSRDRRDSWPDEGFREMVLGIVRQSTPEDSGKIYEAIRLANPGGLGRSQEHDVGSSAPVSIDEAMRYAASWDDVALQYTNGFQQVIQSTHRLLELYREHEHRTEAISHLQVEILASRPDSLILRKHGEQVGIEVQQQATRVLQSGPYGTVAYQTAWDRFDEYLRQQGQRRNPGTTADLIAAAIFLASYPVEWSDE
jgi:triphosphoribosyl-dephospho-CoA synthase